jgi:hypothetical protein
MISMTRHDTTPAGARIPNAKDLGPDPEMPGLRLDRLIDRCTARERGTGRPRPLAQRGQRR